MRSIFYILILAFISFSTAALAKSEQIDTRNPEEVRKDDLYKQPKDIPEKAAKVIAVLKAVNLDHPYLTESVIYVGKNSRDGYLYLMDEEIVDSGIKMQIRYGEEYIYADGKGRKNMQLNFTTEDSHYNLSGSSEGVMVRYKLEF